MGEQNPQAFLLSADEENEIAGDWIKMRGNLWDDPRVARICDLTDSSEGPVIGALYWLWATADQHSENGAMPGLTLRQIDRKTGLAGFAAALCEIGWLIDDPQGVVIQKFEEHNGESAKKRCQTAKRVAKHRAGNAGVTHDALPNSDTTVSSALAREEKRREEKKEPSSLRSEGARVTALTIDGLIADGLTPETAAEWIAHRKRKKAPLTPRAWEGIKAEAFKAQWSLEHAVAKALARGWTGFEAEWVHQERHHAMSAVNRQEAQEQRNRQVAAEWAAQGDQA